MFYFAIVVNKPSNLKVSLQALRLKVFLFHKIVLYLWQKLPHMTQEERNTRYQKLMTQPVGVLIEHIIRLEEETKKPGSFAGG